jgi:hypothetical protein
MHRRRHGFSALLLVFLAGLLLLIWAAAQRHSQASIRKRVRIAEGARRARGLALAALDEGLTTVLAEVNEPTEEEAQESLGMQIRSLTPGQVLEFSWSPERSVKVRGQIYLLGIYGQDQEAEPPKNFDCKKYEKYLIKWSRVPG